MTTLTAHEGALVNEQTTRQLVQDWQTYLRSRLVLLAPDSAVESFEYDPDSLKRLDAERDIAAIPSDLRGLFERAVTQRREQHRQTQENTRSHGSVLADADLLDRTALTELLGEASEPDETGHILVPSPAEHGAIDWLEFRAADLTARPDERAYRIAHRGQASREKTTRIAAGIAIVLLLALAIWSIVRPEDIPANAANSGVFANGQALIPWPANQITISADTTATWKLIPTNGTQWPTDGQAYVEAPAQLPLRVCIPSDALNAIRSIHIAGDGSIPDRVYSIATEAPDQSIADLVLSSCADANMYITAILQSLEVASLHESGTEIRLGDQPVNLLNHTLTGAAEDSSVPQGATRVALRFRAEGVDWTASAPSLRLGDGSQHTAPEVRLLEGNVTELRFLVPSLREVLPAEFRLTGPNDNIIRWQLTIGPAPDRLTILQAALAVGEVSIWEQQTFSIPITNQSAQTLSISSTDFFIEQNGSRLALGTIDGIEVPLEAGESRILTITLLSDLRGVATLHVGAAQFRISE
jgi:hypothetical protein